MTDLKPCPFCGQQAEEEPSDDSLDRTIFCKNSHCVHVYTTNFHQWQNRPIEDALNAEVLRLREENTRIDKSRLALSDAGDWLAKENTRLRDALAKLKNTTSGVEHP
jgi:hypothetical protein